jgi:heme A synthase
MIKYRKAIPNPRNEGLRRRAVVLCCLLAILVCAGIGNVAERVAVGLVRAVFGCP